MSRHALLTLALGLACSAACGTRVEEVVVHRSNCLVCHQPLDDEGEPAGIAEAHPWAPLTCEECHGGQPFVCDGVLGAGPEGPTCDGEWAYDQRRAHPDPAGGPATRTELYGLSVEELDAIDEAWLRFLNPGDLRVVERTCGKCHTTETFAVKRSLMSHYAGGIATPRFRAGKQPDRRARLGATPTTDLSPLGGECDVAGVAILEPPPISVGSGSDITEATIANAQDQYLAKACMSCHLNTYGPGDAPGLYRSAGCTACHMPYADDGLYRGSDPWITRDAPGHPVTHQMQTSPTTAACTHCHHEGARIGLSYQGYRDRAGEGLDPPDVQVLGQALYGRGPNDYISDEDTTNAHDETPADVHFEAGMACVDCHTRTDVHGDNHIYSRAECVVRTTCEDCHGLPDAAPSPPSHLSNVYEKQGEPGLWLTTKFGGQELRIPSIAGNAALEAVHSQAHVQELECVVCHAGWAPSCYGCHVEIDLGVSAPYQTTGDVVPGAPTERAGWVQTQDLVLMRRGKTGKLALSLPAERLFMTLLGQDAEGNPEDIFRDAPRVLDGQTSFGQRPIDPHTTRRLSPFASCDRCHPRGDDPAAEPDNAVLLDLTYGFGTERFVFEGYRLDAIQTREHDPLVTLDETDNRPLSAEDIDAMLQHWLPSDTPETEIPEDAATNPRWPSAPAP